MMNQMPLQYRISIWRQAKECLSNNSQKLHIHTTDFISNDKLQGFRISVDHEIFGTLFACVLNARGLIVSDLDATDPLLEDPIYYELSTQQILQELRKYGFWIEYNPREALPGDQLDYLMTLKGLNYDKIRVMNTWTAPRGVKEFKTNIVVFNSTKHRYWLNNDYAPSEKEFTQALLDGSAANLTEICKTKKFRWDWLDYVANIDDIIRDNAGDNIWDLAWKDVEYDEWVKEGDDGC